MQTDEAISAPEPEKQKSRKALLFWGHVAAFLLGAGLLFVTIWYVGYKTIIDALSKVG